MGMTCQEFIDGVGDNCIAEFLALLPDGSRATLQSTLDAFQAIGQAEQLLSFYFDKMLTKGIDELDEEIAALLIIAKPFSDVVSQLAAVVLPFSNCPSVGILLASAIAPLVMINTLITNSSQRKKQLKAVAKKSTSLILNAIFSNIRPIAVGGATSSSIDDVLNTLDGIKNCLGAVGGLNIPPGTTIDQIADLLGGS